MHVDETIELHNVKPAEALALLDRLRIDTKDLDEELIKNFNVGEFKGLVDSFFISKEFRPELEFYSHLLATKLKTPTQ